MCGRYSITTAPEAMWRPFKFTNDTPILRPFVLALVLMIAAKSVPAQELATDEYTKTVASLHATCISNDPVQLGECRGFFDAIMQFRYLFAKGLAKSKHPCFPVDSTVARSAFLDWVDGDTERGKYTAFSGALAALKVKWPCGQSGTGAQ